MQVKFHANEGPGPVAPGTSRDARRTSSGRSAARTALVGALALGLAGAGLATGPAQAIDSNPPTGPGNIEIFPKRDMVAIEGYSEYAGKTAEIKVLRGGSVIGSAKGTVDSTGFLEVNHPGGVCWGAGGGPQVTPDIKGGDEIRVDFANTGGKWDGARTTDVEITDVRRGTEGNRLVISGRYGAGVDLAKFGIEIVNPDMRGGTSAVGERAIGWPLEAGEPAPTGYSVNGNATNGEFEVTFAFDRASDLDLAEAGEAVALGWQAEAPPELGIEAFYGMTLYEFHEASGPGMGGCPAGPQEKRPLAPTVTSAKGAGDGTIDVTWGAGTNLPEAPAINGYSVTAIRSVSTGLDAGGVVRTAADGRSATISKLDAGEVYDVEVAARSTAGDSEPAVMRVKAAPHIAPTATARTTRQAVNGKYQPLVGEFGVNLDPTPGLISAEVLYTVDGSAPTKDNGTLFVPGLTDPIEIRQDTTVKWIVTDGGNITGPVGQQLYDIVETDVSTQPAPTGTTAVAAPVSGAIDVTIPKLADPAVTAYRIQAYTGASETVETGIRVGTAVSVAQPTDPAATSVTRRMTGLTNGTEYKFSVAARYGTVWSPESVLTAAVAPTAGSAAVAGPDQDVLRGRSFVLDGGASPKAVTYQWTQIRPTTVSNGGLPQDPAFDLNPTQSGVQATTGAIAEPTLTLTAPLLTTPTSDHNLQFRLTTTHSDGVTRSDLVDIKLQADAVTAEEVRWRAGDEIGGTASQENATLTLLNGSPTGGVIGQAVVANGEWTYPSGTPALVNGTIYVWSDYGYTGTITTTN